MDRIDTYVPWELAAKLALYGCTERSYVVWDGTRNRVRYLQSSIYSNRATFSQEVYRKQCMDKYKKNDELFRVFGYIKVASPTYDQVKDWFRTTHKIEFVEMPHFRSTTVYSCDPIIEGKEVKLGVSESPTAARLKAFEHLLTVIDETPIPEVKVVDVEWEETP